MSLESLPPQNKSMSILIVDDEQSIIDMVTAVLARYGFTNVHVAHSGMEALRLAGVNQPQLRPGDGTDGAREVDLALVDIMLPDISGFELCLSLKNEISPHLPVLLMTGYPIESQHAKLVESGADDFINKPFHPVELLARLNLHLTRKRELEQQARLEDTTQPQVPPPQTRQQQLSLIGQEVGPYVTIDAISWSGASMIFRAERLQDKFPCVIKMLTRHALDYEDVVRRFELETRIMRRLDHPHVIPVIDHGEFNGCPYYVMAYLEGRNLELIIAESQVIEASFVVRVAEELGEALQYIHQQQVIHRDLKPKNVFAESNGKVLLGDFGIAVILGDLRVTQEGYTIGTPFYMAPEQFECSEVTPATDIYAYGALLYHLIAGRPPFTASSAMEMMHKHVHVVPESLTRCRADLDPGWNDLIVNRCLAKQVGQRPASMDEVLARLSELDNPFPQ